MTGQNIDRNKVLSPFPQAEKGMTRYVIFVDERPNEGDYKVEIIPGKIMNVDCNIHRLMGNVNEEVVQGWGYTYYKFTTDGKTTSTMMGCTTPNSDKFVTAQSILVRYNSKLPIVVFVPEGYNLKYRIWEAGVESDSPIL